MITLIPQSESDYIIELIIKSAATLTLSEFLEIVQPHPQTSDVYMIRSVCITKELISDIFANPEHFLKLIKDDKQSN